MKKKRKLYRITLLVKQKLYRITLLVLRYIETFRMYRIHQENE